MKIICLLQDIVWVPYYPKPANPLPVETTVELDIWQEDSFQKDAVNAVSNLYGYRIKEAKVSIVGRGEEIYG